MQDYNEKLAQDHSISPSDLLYALFHGSRDNALAAASNPNLPFPKAWDVFDARPSTGYREWSAQERFAIAWAMRDNPALSLFGLEDPTFHQEMERKIQWLRWSVLRESLDGSERVRFLVDVLRLWLPFIGQWSPPSAYDAKAWLDAIDRQIKGAPWDGAENLILAHPSQCWREQPGHRVFAGLEEKDEWIRRDNITDALEKVFAWTRSLAFGDPDNTWIRANDQLRLATFLNRGVAGDRWISADVYDYAGTIVTLHDANEEMHLRYFQFCSEKMEKILDR